MKHKVFVYGALRQGALHAWRMREAQFLGEATVAGTLVKISWYPGLVLGGEPTVKGEVYQISSELLAELDEFEGVGCDSSRPDEYRRVLTSVKMKSGQECECYIYEWLKGISDYEIVSSGDWLSVESSR